MRWRGDKQEKGALGSRGIAAARARAAAPRYLATTTLLVLVALGLRSLLWVPHPLEPTPAPRAAGAPSQDFALRFARAYLAYDAAHPLARERALEPFLGEALGADAGFFAPRGAQRVRWVQVASDQRALAGGRVITVAAALSTRRMPIYLAVVVRHDREHGLSLGGYPALVGAPAVDLQAEVPMLVSVEEPGVATVAERALRNYLAGSAANLRADLSPQALVSLPTVALSMRGVEALGWIGGPGSGAVLATAAAEDARGVTYTLSYEIGIERRERPYVSFIQVIPTDT